MPADPPFRAPNGRFPARPEGTPGADARATPGRKARAARKARTAAQPAKLAAIREIQARGAARNGAPLDPPPEGDAYAPVLPGTRSPAELATALSIDSLRRLERGMHDYDVRVALDCARVLATCTPKVAAMAGVVGDAADPAQREAAVLAALSTPALVAVVVGVAASPEAPLHAALVAAGWSAPGG